MAKTHSLAPALAVLFLVFSVCPAFADYYGYRDAKGVWRYTDDIARVPAAFRKSMKVVKSEKTIEKETAASAPADSKAAPGADKAEGSSGDLAIKTDAALPGAAKPGAKAAPSVADQLDALNKEMAALEKERETLAAEREALQKERSQATNRKAQDAANEKAKAYNERVKAYDARRAAYEKQVKDASSTRAGK
jgi:hypothetical protein